MTTERDFTDQEVAAWIRRRIDEPRGPFSWVTDGTGYRQHMRFVRARNTCWDTAADAGDTWRDFALRYAMLADLEALDAFDA